MEKVYKDLVKYYRQIVKETGLTIDEWFDCVNAKFDWKNKYDIAWGLTEKVGRRSDEYTKSIFKEIEFVEEIEDFNIYKFKNKFIKVEWDIPNKYDIKLSYTKQKQIKVIKTIWI